MNHQDTKTQSSFAPVAANTDELAKSLVDCAFQVHKTLGPGLLESIYEDAFIFELNTRNIQYETQKIIPIEYKNKILKTSYRLDLFVENQIVIELKTVDKLMPVHEAQILTYLKLLNLRLGFLINFNVPLIKQGIKRVIL